MDGQGISPHDLYIALGTGGAPVIVDVRRAQAFAADEVLIAGAGWRDPEDFGRWAALLPPARRVVVYCVHGHEVSQAAAAALRAAGVRATHLEGGIARWREEGLPTRRKHPDEPRKWVTRERPKIDRIACPWLIRRFVAPDAEFLYVPTNRVFEVAAETGARAYDIPGAEPFAHDGELCSFDALIKHYELSDPALHRLALIVRGADTARHDLAPPASGLHAISMGLSANIPDDHAMLEHGMIMYDALYTWCRDLRDDVHNWTPPVKQPVSAPERAA